MTNQPYGKCERCMTIGHWNCPKHKNSSKRKLAPTKMTPEEYRTALHGFAQSLRATHRARRGWGPIDTDPSIYWIQMAKAALHKIKFYFPENKIP